MEEDKYHISTESEYADENIIHMQLELKCVLMKDMKVDSYLNWEECWIVVTLYLLVAFHENKGIASVG